MKVLYSKNYPKTAYGFAIEKRLMPTRIEKQWILVFYFYKWYRAFSNHPLPTNPKE